MVRYSKEDVLERDEIEKLKKACKSGRDRLLLYTLINTGMRISEFCNMKPSWINWQKKEIVIPREDNGWKPKTKAGARKIPIMDRDTFNLLDGWFKIHDRIPFDRSSAFRRIKKIAERTDVRKNVYPHSLRATYATNLIHKGVSVTTLQYLMGWSKLSTAESYIKGSGIKARDELEEKW